MRLLNVHTRIVTEFQFSPPSYAILSHRWGDDEVTLQDIQTNRATSMKGYAKIDGLCKKAAEEGYEYVWMDTCCIDKSSSSELSESINSMFSWYRKAGICYVYMADVDDEEDPAAKGSSFRASVWFTRGWTLQELLAPANLVFFARNWTDIGTKKSLAAVIEAITTIERHVFTRTINFKISIAKRMSWAAKRQTTREEDRAYSLMGIFGVNMPTIYGEGPRAFIRLQQEIMKVSNDHSIFAWRTNSSGPSGLLASSPDQFLDSGSYSELGYQDFVEKFHISVPEPDYTFTNSGVRIQLPFYRAGKGTIIAYLASYHEHGKRIVGLHLKERENHPRGHYRRTNTRELVHDDQIDVSLITIDRIFVAEDNPTMFSSVDFKEIPKIEKYKFKLKLTTSRDFTLSDCYPSEYWSVSSDPVMDLNHSGIYGTATFCNRATGEAFAVILGAHNWQVWSDIRIIEKPETAGWVHEWYRFDNPEDHAGYSRRWDASDRVKKPRLNGGYIVLSMREETVVNNQGIYAVLIAVV